MKLTQQLRFRFNKHGFSLIEILLSMALLVIVGVVVIGMGSGTLINAFSNQDRTRALSYTQEAVEQIRTIRDTNSQDIFSFTGYFSLNAGILTSHPAPSGPNDPDFRIGTTKFYRVIEIQDFDGSSQKKAVTITTHFPEKSVYRSVSLVSYLTDWQ